MTKTIDLVVREVGYFLAPLGDLASIEVEATDLQVYDDLNPNTMTLVPFKRSTAQNIMDFLKGADVDTDSIADLDKLVELIKEFGSVWDSFKSEFAGKDPEYIAITKRIPKLVNKLKSIATTDAIRDTREAQDVLDKIVDHMTILYLQSYRPAVFAAFRLTGVVVEQDGRMVLVGSQLRDAIKSPMQAFRDTHGWGTADFNDQAVLAIAYDLARALDLAVEMTDSPPHRFGGMNPQSIDFDSLIFTEEDLQNLPEVPDSVDFGEMLKITFGQEESGNILFDTGVAIFGLPATDTQQAGLAAMLYGAIALDVEKLLANNWKVLLTGAIAAAAENAIVARPDGVVVEDFTGVSLGDVAATLVLRRENEDVPATRLLDLEAGYLEFKQFDVRQQFSKTETNVVYDVALLLNEVTVALTGGNGDSFLQGLLPQDGFSTTFDTGVGFNTQAGFYLANAGGLTVEIPLAGEEKRSINLLSLLIGLEPKDNGVQLLVGITGNASLGPLKAVVERFGLITEWALIDVNKRGEGQLQLAISPSKQMDITFGFKPPTGVGLAIDAGAVVGGGYLFFDVEREEYAGVLQLEIGDISVGAVGLLTTQMPDGSDGFSLLVIITSEFAAIQLGFGFTLDGLGGLLGINRSVVVDVLREGLRANTLDAIMFPEDPVRNAPQIVSDVRRVFPPVKDQHVFGPMAIVGWGTPNIIRAELGVVLELFNPLRLVVLGKLTTALPSTEADPRIAEINMNVLGVIDFDRKEASLDAVLYDSRVSVYTLEGEMAMRLRWGQDPSFALAIGGMHPRIQPPPGFPSLPRLSLSLGSGDSPRMRLETYLALTSNTVQVGAKLDLYASKGKWSVHGHLGFDALFQFSPFAFEVAIQADMALKRKSRNIMSVRLAFTLAGPRPWHAKGNVTVSVLRWDVTVAFDVTIGPRDRPPLPPPADVWAELEAAIKQPGNWSASLPGQGHQLVTLRDDIGDSGVAIHPLGTLTFKQRVLPLDTTLEMFGNLSVAEGTRFTLSGYTTGRSEGGGFIAFVPNQRLDDFFAPAQFFDFNDEEKVAAPAFEKMPAGVANLGTDKLTTTPTTVNSSLKPHTEKLYTLHTEVIGGDTYSDEDATEEALFANAQIGAAARAPLANSGRSKYEGESQGFALHETSYVLATTDTLKRVKSNDLPRSSDYTGLRDTLSERQRHQRAYTYAETLSMLKNHVKRVPSDRSKYQVVAEYEAA